MQEIRKVVAREFDIVNKLIVEQLHSKVPLVENIGHYIVDAGGKRMRPMLALLTGGASNNLNSHHHTLAAVIEFIHTATLLHDDVVDISTLRRGRATANAEWGNAPSVLVGDFLYSRAFQLLVKIGNMEVMQLMADATNTVAEGEVLQLAKAGDPDTSEQDYFQVINDKTAVLFAAASAGGAILANANEASVKQYYQYGINLGLAFQLIDDVLDYEGDAEAMGKNVGDDLAEGKCTLPLIYAMQHGNPQQAALIKQAITDKSGEQIDAIIDIVRESGAIAHTRQQASEISAKAAASLGGIADSTYKQALLKLANLAINRSA
jgi:octaprenyl-diphosphate synthase